MEWTQDLSVGVGIIDEQHRELFKRINSLVASIKQQICRQTIGDVIKFLEDYIVIHFGEEEKYMKTYDYPEYPYHKAEHAKFMKNFSALRKELPKLEGGKNPGSYELSVETNRVVVDWIREHILSVDKRLGEFLRVRM